MLVVQRRTGPGPADWVTLVRALLAAIVAGMVAHALVTGAPAEVSVLVAISSVALALDWVDGQVARRTGTVSERGARFDMEVDAFLILVLSVHVASSLGWWVLLIGLARYARALACLPFPWMRGEAPPRYWNKVVAAVQGIVLTVVSAGVLPERAARLVLLVALVLLAESFGRETWRLWRTREPGRVTGAATGRLVDGLAALLVLFGLTVPSRLDELGPGAFVRLPVEAVVLLAVLLLLPARASRTATAVAATAGFLLALVTVFRLLDMGFFAALNRPFDAVIDWTYTSSLIHLVTDSVGARAGILVLTAAGLVLVGLLVVMPLAVVRLSRLASRHRRFAARTATVLGAAWLVLAVGGVTGLGGARLASRDAAAYAYHEVSRIPAVLRDKREFEQAAAHDPLSQVPPGRLLTGLRGKDVLFVFVESYGRVAVQGSSFAPGVQQVLTHGTRALAKDGFCTRSAFLTSPTFGAISWLAHSTFQSGLWVDSQQRYDVLMTSPRLTLSSIFGDAGWRTVADVPADTKDWPQGVFYHYDQVYDSRNVGYRGPRFGYPTMPDQYTLEAFHHLELTPGHRPPVMAEIDLISSHAPWSRTPHMIDQQAVGDGSVYDGMPEQLPSETDIWPEPAKVQAAYGGSIEYSLRSLISFVRHDADKNLVLVLLGDHQPATIVSGSDAGHDVPITVVSGDKAVLDPFAGWGWQPGMLPHPDAPVMRMDRFRDRFLGAFGAQRQAGEPEQRHTRSQGKEVGCPTTSR